jgi:RimJ/RimL family protein N-acetyltransferase
MSFTHESIGELPIKQPALEDAPLLRELEHTAFAEPYASPVRNWSFEIRQTPLRTDVIMLEGRPIGLCYVRMIWPSMFNELKQQYGEVALLAVDPDFQRMGIGERLLRAGIIKLTENEADSIVLQTAVENLSMQLLAKKCQFSEDSRLDNYYGPGEDAIQYRYSSRRILG